MRRFFTLMGITIQSRMYYRVGFIFNLTTPLLLLGGQFLLWNSVYGLRDGAALNDFTRPDIYAYILIAFMINSLLTWSSENTLSREIRSGSVTARRLRPVGFLWQSISDMLGNLLIQGVVNVTIVAILFAAFHKSLTLPSLQNAPLFLLSLLFGVLLRMMLVSLFSLLCFFTTGHLGLTWTRTALMEFFSGAMIPVSMFPLWLRNVSYFTPFPLMLQVPVSLFLGKPLPMPLPLTFALQCFWILLFFLLHEVLYNHIRKNVTLAGG